MVFCGFIDKRYAQHKIAPVFNIVVNMFVTLLFVGSESFMNNFKKLTLLSLASLFVVNVSHGFLPTTVINGTWYNVGLPYGVTLQNDENEDDMFKILPNAFYLYQHMSKDATNHVGGVTLSGSYNMQNLLEGLSVSVHAPLMAARTNRNGSASTHTFTVNDVDAALSYNFLKNNGHEGTVSAGVTIPTAKTLSLKKSDAIALGNGGHVALFTTVDMKNRLVGNDDHNLSLVSGLEYRYLISSNKKIQLGLANINDLTGIELVGDKGSKAVAKDVLTQTVKVSPGSQLNGRLGLMYQNSGFFAGAGALASYKQGISASLSKKQVSLLTALSKVEGEDSVVKLTEKDITLPFAKTADRFTLRGYADVGYEFKAGSVPAFVSAGVEFPVATRLNNLKNKAGKCFESFDVNVKTGFSF